MAEGESGRSVATVMQPAAEKPEIPFYVFRLHVRQARASVTRCINEVPEAAEPEEASRPRLRALRRRLQSISSATDHLCDLFDKWVLFPELNSDDAKLAAEFEKHELYSAKASAAIEGLQQRIDTIADQLGVDPDEFTPKRSAVRSHGESQPGGQGYVELNPGPVDIHSAVLGTVDQQQYDFAAEPQGEDGQARYLQSTPLPAPIYVAQDPASKVPKFSGDPLKYQEWHDMFAFYVDAQHLDPTEKCRILKACMTGRAGRPIAHLRVCPENYELMKKIIKDRFGGLVQIQASHIHRIHTICDSKDLDKDARLVEFVSQLGQQLHSLAALGCDLGSLSIALVPVILAAIPLKQRMGFNAHWRKVSSEANSQLETLLSFLEDHASLLEECEQQAKLKPNGGNKGSSASVFQRGKFQQKQQGKNGFRHVGSFSAGVSGPDHSCIFCFEDHDSFKCNLKLTPEERRKRAANAMACFRCLRRNHSAKDCRAKRENCKKCRGRHASILCIRQESGQREAETVENSTELQAASLTAGAAVLQARQSGTQSETVLQTGYVWILSEPKKLICRVILDPGSQRSFMSSRVARALGLTPIGAEDINIHGIAGHTASRQRIDMFNITVKSRFSDRQIKITALAVPEIIQSVLPRASLKSPLWGPLADEKEPGFPEKVDLLLGADVLPLIYDGMYRKVGSIIASPTIFGWFTWGNSGLNHYTGSVVTSLGVVQSVRSQATAAAGLVESQSERCQNLKDIDFLWDTEILGIEVPQQDEAEAANHQWERFFRESVTRDESGRYVVSLPFKDNIAALGDNQKIAYSRLMGFLKHARKNQQLLNAVDNEIQKCIDLGYAEPAEPRIPTEQAHYLPLLAVAKKSLANSGEFRVRVVKDGGCRSRDEASLNDVLEKGPNCLPDIVRVLLHFRRRTIAIVADIVKAFNQIAISKKDRKFLRFYWTQGISKDPSAPVREFWATVLDFGLVCSPWLHCAAVKHHLDCEMRAHPELSPLLLQVSSSFYMDDISIGADSLSEAKQAVDSLREVFLRGKFPLDKWASNDAQLSSYIQNIAGSSESTILPREQTIKFLGIPWCRVDDTLSIEVSETASFMAAGVPTKRKLLKGLSRIFDPLNIVAPISINFKILLQSLWVKKVDWDVPLDGEAADSYVEAVKNLQWCKNLAVERNMIPSFPQASRELHVFADASLKAYGAVAYIRQMPIPGSPRSPTVSFAMAKARVAPLKGRHTIHRLELLAAIIAVRVAKKVLSAQFLEIGKVFYYSDNAAVLGWLRDPSRLGTFVGRRVAEILAESKVDDWNYIRSEENPSDLLSRGSPLDTPEFIRHWLKGPAWLLQGKEASPHALNGEQTGEGDAERVQSAASLLSSTAERPPRLFAERFSTWSKAVRVTSYVRRFISGCRAGSPDPRDLVISAAEFAESEIILLKNIQGHYFHEELKLKCEKLPRASALFKLSPFVDKHGLIRCRSRLQNSELLSYDEKNPIILPGDDFLVQLYVRWVHGAVCLHSGGVEALLHHLRARVLILKARATAKKALAGCKTCVKFRAKQAILPQATLPAFRIESAAPFSFTGVDHAGPLFYQKESGEKAKCYILLFVCAVTRAVRLELVGSLSTYDFLLAFRAFINRNPGVKHLISDNARTFHRAKKELFSLYDQVQSPSSQSLLAKHRLEWSFSTSRCPWAGGFFERVVGIVKNPLRRAVGIRALPFRELQVLLSDVERVVNQRPITAVVSDPNEFKALAPADLLYGYSARPGLPDVGAVLKAAEEAKSIVFSARWRRLQSVLQSFWKSFRSGYLQYLRTAHAAAPQDSRPLRVGDVCILKSSDASKAFWPLCIVQKLFGGRTSDGLQRSCVIKTAGGQILERPIKLLYPLEVTQF